VEVGSSAIVAIYNRLRARYADEQHTREITDK
jgi:hypothetical protein